MNHDSYDNAYVSGILNSVRTIAIVGASANDVRPSFFVTKYLIDKGFEVFPINPGHAGRRFSAGLFMRGWRMFRSRSTWSTSFGRQTVCHRSLTMR